MIEFELLAKVVEEVSGTPKETLISKRRPRPLVELRMICSNTLKENHKLSVEKIGGLLNINHATVSYHLKTHKNLLLQRDGKYRKLYEEISKKYRQSLVINGGDVRAALLEKRKKLEQMLEEVDSILQMIDQENKLEELKT